MARVMLRLYTTLKDRVGTGKIWVEGDHVAAVLDRFVADQGAPVQEILLDAQRQVRPHFVLALNSQVLDRSQLHQVPVQDGDLLHVFPPIAGG